MAPRLRLAVAALALCAPLAAAPAPAPERLAPLSPSAFSRARSQQPARIAAAAARLAERARKRAHESYALRSAQTDRFGQTHARFSQRHRGVRVWGGEVVTHTGADGAELPPTNASHPIAGVEVAPAIAASQALAVAEARLGSHGPWARPPTTELVVYPVTVERIPTLVGRPVNAVDVRREVVRHLLAWHVHTELENGPADTRHTDFLVDARDGRVLRRWSTLHSATTLGVGHTQYSGEVALETDGAPGAWVLRDAAGNETRDQYGLLVDSPGVLRTDADDTWGDGLRWDKVLSSSPSGQTAMADAHYGLGAALAYFREVHGRDGWDGAGTPTQARVHVYSNYDNAFWSEGCNCINLGDGSGVVTGGYDTFTALDVVAHELAHGVTESAVGLVYDGESGGLSEASSDIFAAMTEFHARGGGGATVGESGGTWTLGEQLSPDPIRYMQRPSTDGLSPDAWQPGWDWTDVHFAAGPMNRAFYFLAQGATTSGDGWSYYLPEGMQGIGNDAAARIWYRMVTTYLTPASRFVDARSGALRAASDLFGRASPEFLAVGRAFAAVNVGWSDPWDDVVPPRVTARVDGAGRWRALVVEASDAGGIAGVELGVDGSPAGTLRSLPYVLPYDTILLAAGEHAFQASVRDRSGNTTVVSVPFTIANGSDQLLANPGFELGETGWSGSGVAFQYPSLARTGEWFGWFGGSGALRTDRAAQVVTLPSTATGAALSFFLYLEAPYAGVPPDTFTVTVTPTGQPAATLLWLTPVDSDWPRSSGWRQVLLDLGAYVGETIELTLALAETGTGGMRALVDDVALTTFTGTDVEPPRVVADVIGTAGPLRLVATVSDDTFCTVEYLVDGAPIATAAGKLGVDFDSTALADGLHELTVRAVDAGGNEGWSAPVPFGVDNGRTQLVQDPGFESGTLSPSPWTFTGPCPAVSYWTYWRGDWGASLNLCYEAPPLDTRISQVVAIPSGATSAILSLGLWLTAGPSLDPAEESFALRLRHASTGAELVTLRTWTLPEDASDDFVEHRFDVTAYAGQSVRLSLEAMTMGAEVDDVQLEVTTSPDLVAPEVRAAVDGSTGTVDLTARATDEIAVKRIELWVDGVLRGGHEAPGAEPLFVPGERGSAEPIPAELTAAVDSALLGAGEHLLVARAWDLAGNLGESAPVPFGVPSLVRDLVAPTVTASVTRATGTFTFAAEPVDDVGVYEVEFYVDGAFVGRSRAAPYQLTVAAAAYLSGSHQLVARAYDDQSNVGSSAAVRFGLNRSPAVAAPASLDADERLQVTVDASGSSDPDGDPITFQWAQRSGPPVAFDGDAAQLVFQAPEVAVDTDLVFELVVSDGLEAGVTVTVTVTVRNVNRAPVASAGADAVAPERLPAVLDASDSYDPDGDPITFAWTQLSGTPVTLDDPASATPGFVVPEVPADEPAVFRVVVDDGAVAVEATVTLTFTHVDAPPPPPPPPPAEDPAADEPAGGCGCGVGRPDAGLLALGLVALLARRRRGVRGLVE